MEMNPQDDQQQWNQPQTPAQPQPQQPPQGQYAPYVHPYPPQPRRSAFEGVVKTNPLTNLIALGVILILLGMIMLHAAPLTTNYGSNPPDDSRRIADDQAFGNTLTAIGNILTDLGLFFIAGFLMLAGILRKDMDKLVRVGLLIAAGVILGFWII